MAGGDILTEITEHIHIHTGKVANVVLGNWKLQGSHLLVVYEWEGNRALL
jgi:hypothetical protein